MTTRRGLFHTKAWFEDRFKLAWEDFLSGNLSPFQISRNLVNDFHLRKAKLPPADQPDFENWFREHHDALGKKIMDEQLPKPLKRKNDPRADEGMMKRGRGAKSSHRGVRRLPLPIEPA